MTPSELREVYSQHPKTKALAASLEQPASKVHLHGAIGGSQAMIASGLIEARQGCFLFVLEDKEAAAYFMNDLESCAEGYKPLFFPRSARVPYQEEQTENANISMRAEVLNEVNKGHKMTAVVTFPEALAEKVVTRRELSKNTFDLKVGDTFDMEFIDEAFQEFGFEKVDYVFEPGQYSVRGGIVDVFSFSFDHPYRIEFFGDEVESIRKFDPVSQLTVNAMAKATIVPNLRGGMMQESHESFLEFMPEKTVVWMQDVRGCSAHLDEEVERARVQFSKLTGETKRLTPEELYTTAKDLDRLLEAFCVVEFGREQVFVQGERIGFKMQTQPAFAKNFDLLATNLNTNAAEGYTTVIASNQPKQIERLYAIFEDKDADVSFTPVVIELSEGFIDPEQKLLCYTDHQIFERYHRFRLKEGFKRNKAALTIKELSGLQPGDFVVHIDHGIGEFSGLQKIDVNGKEQETIRLKYKDGDILYVSIHSLHRISKFVGKEGTAPKINKLGTQAWSNLKRKTKSQVKKVAFDLLKLYAKRKTTKGFAFSPDSYLQHELEASFMYEDTPDQVSATEAIKKDMEAEFPMDRLVCGDVGFGKTELAVRAAFKAVADNKQVAILVPTTILSLQHFKSFSARLKDFPCRVDYINRFKTAKQKTQTLNDLKEGKVDILIGTHAIVGKRVEFKDLGLLVIDEEQKFGVSVKDKLKTLKENVDTLTLTATPIPRTLQFSMMGARDLSILKTPPANRYPIQTEIRPHNEELIRDALAYEISRGGQAYFVHNRVGNIKEVAGMLQRLVPDIRVGIGHGQMTGDQLEEVMSSFIDGSFDVLVATTIIESGIDISNANTMIISEAQNYGLSDLHQLRGRVGRSNKKAFCYLMAPPLFALPSDARKRLQALEQFSDLGAGLSIATRDLDIRGAGNLLGGEQSGFMADIGFETYQKILNEAIDELKQDQFKEMLEEEEIASQQFVKETNLETDFEILFPDEYVSSITERIALYRELDGIQSNAELEAFKTRLVDRFGELPRQAEDLMSTMQLRWMGTDIGFEKLVLKGGKMICHFVADQESPFYQSAKFSRVLSFIKAYPTLGKMYEKNDILRMSFVEIDRIEKATEVLTKMLEIESVA